MYKKIILCMLLFSLTSCSGNKSSESSSISQKQETVTSSTVSSVSTSTSTQTTTSQTTAVTTTVITTTAPPMDIPDGQLVRILDYIPDAVIDLRYATENNFTGTVIYDDPEAYLCFGTVKKLINVQNEVKKHGYSILIWDAYRSPEAQQRLWEVYPDPNFVADPRNGITNHSRGNTMDISMADGNGTPVEMPSAFDEFNSSADREYSDVSETAAENAQLLENIMYGCGFTGYRGEWWDYSDTERYELIPVSKN